jgi:hypothetical protein
MLLSWFVTSSCGNLLFFAIAAIASLLYGWNCWTINELDWNDALQEEDAERWKKGTWPWKAHQIWLNFLGSALGWWAFWILLLDCKRGRDCPQDHPLTYIDFALLIVAFLGMTGYLPHVSRYGSNLYPGKK